MWIRIRFFQCIGQWLPRAIDTEYSTLLNYYCFIRQFCFQINLYLTFEQEESICNFIIDLGANMRPELMENIVSSENYNERSDLCEKMLEYVPT